MRYIVDDVDTAIHFYEQLGFELVMHPAPPFAMLSRGELRLVLSAPNPMGGGQPMPDGTEQRPGGWNRFAVEVADLNALVERLRESGARFRNDIVAGVGGRQILLEDPSGNPVELFQPLRDEARLDRGTPDASAPGMLLDPIGRVRSPLRDRKNAPRQGSEGAPDAWIDVRQEFARALDGMTAGDEIIVITWLHRSNRSVLEVHPRNAAPPMQGRVARVSEESSSGHGGRPQQTSPRNRGARRCRARICIGTTVGADSGYGSRARWSPRRRGDRGALEGLS